MDGRDDRTDITNRLMRHEVQFGEVMKALGEDATATRMAGESLKEFKDEFRRSLDRVMDQISVIHERISTARKEAQEGDDRIRKDLEPLKTFKVQIIAYWTAAVVAGGFVLGLLQWIIGRVWS